MTTGERIKECRKRLSMKAEDLAKKVNVSRATIFRWENGEIEKVPITIMEPLAEALQTTPEYLMGWADKDNNNEPPAVSVEIKHPEVRILAKGFDAMPEAERKRALEIARMIFEKYAYLFDEKEQQK